MTTQHDPSKIIDPAMLEQILESIEETKNNAIGIKRDDECYFFYPLSDSDLSFFCDHYSFDAEKHKQEDLFELFYSHTADKLDKIFLDYYFYVIAERMKIDADIHIPVNTASELVSPGEYVTDVIKKLSHCIKFLQTVVRIQKVSYELSIKNMRKHKRN